MNDFAYGHANAHEEISFGVSFVRPSDFFALGEQSQEPLLAMLIVV